MSVTAASQPARAAASDVRLVRAAAFATTSTALASAAHAAAGGPLGPVPILWAWLLVAGVAAAGAGREQSLPVVVGALLASQLGLHLLFAAGHALFAPPAAGVATPDLGGITLWGCRMWWQRRPTRADRAARVGAPPARGAWCSVPLPLLIVGVPLVVALGWALPVLGATPAAFLVADVLIGLVRRRRSAG